MQHPQRDELGLPILPPHIADRVKDVDVDDLMQRMAAGDFSGLGMPAPLSMPTAEEVQREARERSTDVLSQWNTLRNIVARHEEVLRKRWMKKTKKNRVEIITRAWPNMPSMHRADFEGLRREGPKIKTEGSRLKEWYMWPYMNIEDLVKGKAFLLFLNSR